MAFGAAGKTAVMRQKTILLRPGRVMRVRQPGVIRIYDGVVWLTGTPAKMDVILRAGERFELKGDCPYVVEVLAEAKIGIDDGV
jgi:hypothetical protein